MEIRWLEDFCALARTRHFSRAAEEQNISQPTFSRRIKLLEEEMGMMLIDRETLPLSLTPAGKLFLETSLEITRQLREAKEACKELEQAEADKLRFATTQSFYLNFFKPWITALHSDVELGVNLKSAAWVCSQLLQALEQGQCDIIVCYWSPEMELFKKLNGNTFDHLTIGEETLIPVTAVESDGQLKYRLPGNEASPLPYISYSDQTALNCVIHHHINNAVAPPHLLVVNENSQASSVKAMVAEGYGVGWLPARMLTEDDQCLVQAGGSQWRIPLQIRVYRSRHNHRKQLEKLWVQIEQSIQP